MMVWLAQIDWRAPWWGLLACVPVLFAGLAARKRTRLLRYADVELLPWAVSAATEGAHARSRQMTLALAWVLLALAAAGPRIPLHTSSDINRGAPAQAHALSVMLLVDVSASMRANDIAPDRLTRARLELLDMLPRLHGERVGVIAYAGEAGVLIPPTDDPDVLRGALLQVEPSLFDVPGTNLPAALELARRTLASAPAKAILLVTDAEADSFTPALRAAVSGLRQDRIPLFILGTGTAAGAAVTLADGKSIISRMDAQSYAELARSSGGQFVAVADGDSDSVALMDRGIAQVPGGAVTATQVRVWRELYQWALLPALLLLMLGLFPRSVSMLALGAMVTLSVVQGSNAWADERAAWQAWQAQRYAGAQTQYAQLGSYPGYLGAGAAAWRLHDYAWARRDFSSALLLARTARERADALYNLGNAHYGLGNWSAAIGAYQSVLQMRRDVRAERNLAQAVRQLSRQRSVAPMKSDLFGRRGKLAEGTVNLDWDEGFAVKEFERSLAGVQKGLQASSANGAQVQGAAGAVSPAIADARRLQSGLKKIELLQERPHDLLKNLLKQDASPAPTELSPW